MQKVQNENHQGAGAEEARPAEGLGENTGQIELIGDGWSSPIGWCRKLTFISCMTDGIEWWRVVLPSFMLGQTAGLLTLQGQKLQDFFSSATRFRADVGHLGPTGPFLLLKGALSKPNNPPLRLIDVVLASVTRVPEGMKEDELLSKLLAAVLRPT
jgi:hypothetical protein